MVAEDLEPTDVAERAISSEPVPKKNKKKKKKKAKAAHDDTPSADAIEAKPADSAVSQTPMAQVDDEKSPAQEPTKAKKKRKKKSKAPQVYGVNLVRDNQWKIVHPGQTFPPTRPVSTLYPDGQFPIGEIAEHARDFNTHRMTSEDKKAADPLMADQLKACREAAEIHRQVRQDAQRFIRPGMPMVDICRHIEQMNLRLMGFDPANPLARSWGFPTGCSLNHVAAHWTPNSGDDTVLQKEDVMKIDFGTQINGYIVDCAFTMAFDPKYDRLLECAKDATNTGIQNIGVDVRMCDIGAAVSEVINSYTIELDGVEHEIKPVANLCGHDIAPYRIHGGKSIPSTDNGDQTKMEEGEMYALETFSSTGSGRVHDWGDCSHFMRNWEVGYAPLRSRGAKQLLSFINKRFGTLAFCRRWLDDEGQTRHLMSLNQLVQSGLIEPAPALADKPGSYTAQFEHTILLRPTCKEIVSRGDDF